ncbi:MAG: FIST C-terminal domain-containing protein [Proteobacteria bacterium]|nr:FIST C-terminal domain-containing protein [Pseudomonadota bacterium]
MPNRLFAYTDARPAAVAEVIARWRHDHPGLGVLLLLPEAEKAHIPAIQAVFREAAVPLLGAVFPALIVNDEFVPHGAWLIGLDPMPPAFLVDGIDGDVQAASARIVSAVRQVRRDEVRDDTLFLIFDATVPTIGSILLGLYGELQDGVEYAGVNAGSETFQRMPCLFDHQRLVDNGVAGLLMPALKTVVKHEYPVARSLMQATSTQGNKIKLIDQRPAMEVYRELIQAEYGVALTHDNFYDYAVHYPFGLVMAANVVVRIPVGFEEDGSIICVGEIPPYSILSVLKAPGLETSRCVTAITNALGCDVDSSRDALVTFYCAGRRLHLQDDSLKELRQLRRRSGASRLVGALSLGEISSFEDIGIPDFHNAALVCF